MADWQKGLLAVVVLFLLIGVWLYAAGGFQNQMGLGSQAIGTDVMSEMSRINEQVAQEAVTQYGIAKRNGTAVDACVQAMTVAAAYLQASNEPRYQHWKRVEQADCALAGITR